MKKLCTLLIAVVFFVMLCSCTDNVHKDDLPGFDISGHWEGAFPDGSDVVAEISKNSITLFIGGKEVMDTAIYNYIREISGGSKMIFFRFDDNKVLGQEGNDVFGYIENAYIPYYYYSETDSNITAVTKICLIIESANHITTYDVFLSRLD